jgi:hypothetical protein
MAFQRYSNSSEAYAEGGNPGPDGAVLKTCGRVGDVACSPYAPYQEDCSSANTKVGAHGLLLSSS